MVKGNNMKKIILYIACSLDGFIADEQGGVDWLESLPNPTGTDHGYTAFLEEIDTVVMGRKTYEKVLSMDVDWPYSLFKTIVFSNSWQGKAMSPQTEITANLTRDSIQGIRNQSNKDIWIVGGGMIVARLLAMNAIDEIRLFIAPVILGRGTPLFPEGTLASTWICADSVRFDSGIVQITYKRQQTKEE
jgi:dihydrofolate reductase